MQFAYTGELRVDINNVETLYTTANYFKIEKVKGFCEEFIIENLTTENVIGVNQLGDFFTSAALIDGSNTFISNHFVDLSTMANDEFLALEKDSLVSLLSRSDLVVNSEYDVWNAPKIWINHDQRNRGKFIFELLQKVRLSLVDLKDLDIIAQYPLLASSTDCMNRIDDARKYKHKPLRRNEIDVGETTRRGYPVGKIHILGGFLHREISSSKFEKFVGESLEQKANMQIKRICHGVAVLNGKIHITGGYDGEIQLNSCELYSSSNSKPVLVTPMNFKRSEHGYCAHKGKLYVCGGKDGLSSSCCERLETSEGKWRFIANMNVQRKALAVVSCGEYLWAFGGSNHEDEALNSSKIYDENKDMWTMSIPMIERRSCHSAVAFRSYIYVLGG